MDKLVRRVTVVQSSGEHRTGKVVYERDEDEDLDEDEDEDEDREPSLKPLERTVRHMLKAQLIAAQEAYQRHLDAAAKGGNSWLVDDALNMMKVSRKARKEMQKASPFRKVKVEVEDEDDEDEGD
jgi:Family of unknown function (DUF6312)